MLNRVGIIGYPIMDSVISTLAHKLAEEASKNHDTEIIQMKKDLEKYEEVMNSYSNLPSLHEIKPIYDDTLFCDFPERSNCRKFRNTSETSEVGYKNRIAKRRKKNKNKKTHR